MDIPRCPKHNIEMIVKTAFRGKYAGNKFWGCPTWEQTKCNIIYPISPDQEIKLKKVLNTYNGLNVFQKIKLIIKNINRWLNESYYISGTSVDGAARHHSWIKKTTNGQELIRITINFSVITFYIISKKLGNTVLFILICLPFLFIIVNKIINEIKYLLNNKL